MDNQITLQDLSSEQTFLKYEMKFKALADKKRLHILNILNQKGEMCVCDLAPIVNMTQSKLSYHLKILFDANILTRETRGTWSYYHLNMKELNHLLPEELIRLFNSSSDINNDTEEVCCSAHSDTTSNNGDACCSKK
ncbi:ArsR/SmtB family transcription factor [Bacillus solimangrovi]|uniref:ArsR/SmtB family transcription factor n=1 Tax=Bacillus solimangrovi TaxID=1305675 RepID=UPI0009F40CBD